MGRKYVKHEDRKYVVKGARGLFGIRWKIEGHTVLFTG
jgi:hypothetical protein